MAIQLWGFWKLWQENLKGRAIYGFVQLSATSNPFAQGYYCMQGLRLVNGGITRWGPGASRCSVGCGGASESGEETIASITDTYVPMNRIDCALQPALASHGGHIPTPLVFLL